METSGKTIPTSEFFCTNYEATGWFSLWQKHQRNPEDSPGILEIFVWVPHIFPKFSVKPRFWIRETSANVRMAPTFPEVQNQQKQDMFLAEHLS